MDVLEHELKMLEIEGGKCPFEDWYKSIKDTATRARVRARITRIQSGNFGDCKNVGKGVQELRIDIGPGYRVYFARAGSTVVVLLVGGDKSTQDDDIKRAQDLWEGNKDAIEGLQRDFRG